MVLFDPDDAPTRKQAFGAPAGLVLPVRGATDIVEADL